MNENQNVQALGARRNDLDALATQIKTLLYEKPGTPLNITEALGVLEVVKAEILAEAL